MPRLLRLAAVTLVALVVNAAEGLQNIPSSIEQHPQANFVNTTADWPSLRLNFTIKRRVMEVFGQPSFTMFASPSSSSSNTVILYDAFATFIEDSILFNYTLMDGVSYITQSSSNGSLASRRCQTSDMLLPINSIIAAINNASGISPSKNSILCSSGNLFKASVDGTDFALCASGSSGFTMHGSDVDIAVEYMNNQEKIKAPSTNASFTHKCLTTTLSSIVTPIGKALLSGAQTVLNESRKLEAAFGFSELFESKCSCRSKPRPCIFIHGLGVSTEEPDNQDSFPAYWGNVTDHTPCCSTTKYAHLDTVNNSWTSAMQQQKVCDRALAVSETSTGSVIADTIVFTHSMGGLMMSGALANGRCSLASSSTWVSAAAPMRGSMGSDTVQESCLGETNAVLEEVGDITGRCPASTGLKSLAYENGKHSPAALNAAYKSAQEAYRANVGAVMCSEGYSGLRSSYQVEFWLLGGVVVSHKSHKNDGMVEFQSCAGGFPLSKFGNSYLERFYVSKLNHYDQQFRAGDSLLEKDKMPVKWFECLL
ncbi:hypothetical protein PHYBOEH_004447 [Phytophthora boehmeriae]|uniref:Uncharacterized protein n=1 Tax=Phytophthora boehmeriae TaxID=109152 RepID=A0A8T1WNE6_9STRA|nr:hypothetical protein PHYBOEH_004447 [Phytophthora boehmeriae]